MRLLSVSAELYCCLPKQAVFCHKSYPTVSLLHSPSSDSAHCHGSLPARSCHGSHILWSSDADRCLLIRIIPTFPLPRFWSSHQEQSLHSNWKYDSWKVHTLHWSKSSFRLTTLHCFRYHLHTQAIPEAFRPPDFPQRLSLWYFPSIQFLLIPIHSCRWSCTWV